MRQRLVRVTTAAEAAARDADAIASGMPSFALMLAAGTAAAQCIRANWAERLNCGAVVYAGVGNNGGDACVVAARLLEAGVPVTLHAVGEPRTPDAKRARELYKSVLAEHETQPGQLLNVGDNSSALAVVVVDGVLGTGQRGELREAERAACRAMNDAGKAGAIVVALDMPTGVNATTGEIAADAVRASHTLAFGTMKRAHLLQRAQTGAITVLDIGLGAFAEKDDGAWTLADAAMLAPLVPRIEWSAHKGIRGRLAIVGGARGMAGAIVLASRAALRAGVGLVYTHTASESAAALQIAVPQVVARRWPRMPENVHAAAIGPGLGRDAASRRVLNAALHATIGIPTVLDADALTLLAMHDERESDADDSLDERLDHMPAAERTVSQLRALGSTRPVVCTPHVGEFARMIASAVYDTLEGGIAQATAFARETGVVVLLKGTPTVVASPFDVSPLVIPRGTAVLATGGSGDLLTGLIGTLLAQGASPRDAAAIGAWIHGRAAELATEHAGTVRGVTLDEVLLMLPHAWRELEVPAALPEGVLAELPGVS